jgi:hypothetical protein
MRAQASKALDELSIKMTTWRETADTLGPGLKGAETAWTDFEAALIREEARKELDRLESVFITLREAADTLSPGLKGAETAWSDFEAAILRAEARKNLDASALALLKLREETDTLSRGLVGLEQPLSDTDRAIIRATASYRKLVEEMRRSNEVLRLELMGRTEAAALLQAEATARERLGRELLPAEQKQIAGLVAEQERLNAALRLTRDVAGSLERAFDNVGEAITDSLVKGKREALDFHNIMNAFLTDLLNQLIKIAIIRPIATGVQAGLGSLVSAFIPGAGTATVGAPIAETASGYSLRQHGGPVAAGQPAIVGEGGPELWWPNAAGRVIPAGSGSAIGGGVKIEIINQAPGVTVRPGGRGRGPDGRDIQRLVVETVNGGFRAGMFDGAVQGRFSGVSTRTEGR